MDALAFISSILMFVRRICGYMHIIVMCSLENAIIAPRSLFEPVQTSFPVLNSSMQQAGFARRIVAVAKTFGFHMAPTIGEMCLRFIVCTFVKFPVRLHIIIFGSLRGQGVVSLMQSLETTIDNLISGQLRHRKQDAEASQGLTYEQDEDQLDKVSALMTLKSIARVLQKIHLFVVLACISSIGYLSWAIHSHTYSDIKYSHAIIVSGLVFFVVVVIVLVMFRHEPPISLISLFVISHVSSMFCGILIGMDMNQRS